MQVEITVKLEVEPLDGQELDTPKKVQAQAGRAIFDLLSDAMGRHLNMPFYVRSVYVPHAGK